MMEEGVLSHLCGGLVGKKRVVILVMMEEGVLCTYQSAMTLELNKMS